MDTVHIWALLEGRPEPFQQTVKSESKLRVQVDEKTRSAVIHDEEWAVQVWVKNFVVLQVSRVQAAEK